MKNGKILRTLAVAFALALLLVAIPAAPALAADIELDPEEGEIGEKVRVSRGEFTDNRTARIYFSSQEPDSNDDLDDEITAYELLKETTTDESDGELYDNINIPSRLTDGDDDEDVHGGTYYVLVTYSTDRIRDWAEFTVIAGEITLYPERGTVGTEVRITGTDFGASEDITVEYDGDGVVIDSGDDDTSSSGGFTSYILIPPSAAGDHTITVTDDPGSEAEATFTVEPEITITPTSGGAGTTVTASGTGFSRSSSFSIFIGNEEVVVDGRADSDGSFEVTFNVPILGPGIYNVEAWDDDDNSDGAKFTIAASARLSPTTGNVGTELTASGTGFIVGGTVTIKYNATQIAATTADANGVFSVTFSAPSSQHGEHTVNVSDGTTDRQFTFTMESQTPSIPPPLTPEMEVKAEAETYFDWQDVTDPSGVTYTLQIAPEADFASIVLEKTGLTDSEYTVTEEERLESVSKKAPYYWRVKAVDGASNESGWSGAGSFYVGFSLNMPQWAIYTLFGVGALLLGGIGFWAGRKTAFY